MFARGNHGLKLIVIFLILYAFLNLVLNFYSIYIKNFLLIYISDKLLLFLTFFLFQRILIFLILYISFLIAKIDFKSFIFKIKDSLYKKITFKQFLKYTVGMYFLVYIFFIILGIILFILQKYGIYIPGFGNGVTDQNVAVFLKNLTLSFWWQYVTVFVIVAILAPLFEEIIFRVFITDILLKHFNQKLAIFLSAFIFAFIHLEWKVFFNLFILSLFLAYIWAKNRSLILNFTFHFLVNGISLVLMWIFLN